MATVAKVRLGGYCRIYTIKWIRFVSLTSPTRSNEKPAYEVEIACRYGGEEFVIILPEVVSEQGVVAAERLRHNVETKGALAVAERIRKHVEMARKEEAPVTVSIGVASYPEHGVRIETLIKAADDAVYLAKRSGKNRVVVAGGAGTEATPPGVADG